MSEIKNYPRIQAIFEGETGDPMPSFHEEWIRSYLRKLIQVPSFFEPIQSYEERRKAIEEFNHSMPVVKWYDWEHQNKINFSVLLFCRHRFNAGKFFYDMTSRWISPGKRHNVGLFFGTDFVLPDFGEQLYTFCKLVIRLENEEELERIKKNLHILETELRLGVSSLYHANRILEVKGLSADEKTSMVQERVTAIVHRRARAFDFDIFGEMQHFLVRCREEFKSVREFRHMTRIIFAFYLYRKALRNKIEGWPGRRHILLKVSKATIHMPFGAKPVLSIFIGMNFLGENEVFEKKHILKAIKQLLPDISAVEGSYIDNQTDGDRINTVYVEIEKKSGEAFSSLEIKKLKEHLPEELKSRIERWIKPVFMPRNEEEVIRHIVTLSQELKFLKDLPQVVIIFDEHTEVEISFTVILLRILKPQDLPVKELIESSSNFLKFIPERVKKIGVIRKKYFKEANVFRVKLPTSAVLRGDQSVDLFKARQKVSLELQQAIGDFRDYNGGMISKQLEVLYSLKESMQPLNTQKEVLLENFFHSIFPIELRSVLDAKRIKTLFEMFLELLEKEESYGELGFRKQEQEEGLYLFFSFSNAKERQNLLEAVEGTEGWGSKVLTVQLQLNQVNYLGFVYFSESEERRASFLRVIEQNLDICSLN